MMMTGSEKGDESGASSGTRKVKTAGVIVIGDEILKGQVIDTNSQFLCKELYSLGVKLGRISVIGDKIEEIAHEISTFSKKFDFVLTTGGIGPTHDDLTYVGLAEAFNDTVTQNAEMTAMIRKWLGHKGYKEHVIMRMATMPSSAQLLFDPEQAFPLSSFPIVVVQNVYVFPGVPRFLEKMFPRMYKILGDSSNRKFNFREIFVRRDELSITTHLDEAVVKFKDLVVFGSYPVVNSLYYSTRLTMEAIEENHVDEAHKFLVTNLPENSVVDFDSQPLVNAANKVYAIVEDPQHTLHVPVSQAVSVIEEALDKYDLDKMCICFNGGKDCTALLHLFYAVILKRRPNNKLEIKALCIKIDEPFVEMEMFINDSSKRYKLNLWTYNNSIRLGLKTALAEHPELQTVLMGTRRTDPSGQHLANFQMTDGSWPQVMRVSPLLDWSYKDVWQFLRSLSLPYCSLYDRGYTSIGCRNNTLPNPALLMTQEGHGEKRYRPAYELDNSLGERNGRQ